MRMGRSGTPNPSGASPEPLYSRYIIWKLRMLREKIRIV
jgi:hypothetical protein